MFCKNDFKIKINLQIEIKKKKTVIFSIKCQNTQVPIN